MRILCVELTNIKSYRSLHVDFDPGVNFICGVNGSGKSTIIEAIGCAVFGSLRDSISDLVTLGETSGDILVKFLHGGHRYTARRTLSAQSSRNSWQFERDGALCPLDTDREKKAWLSAELNIDGDPASHFAMVLGAYQGSFRYPFDEIPSKRTEHFDALFGVERYRKLYRGSAASVNELDHEIELNVRDIAMHSELSAGLDDDAARMTELEARRAGSQNELVTATAQAALLEKKLTALSELADLEKRHAQALSELTAFDAGLDAATQSATQRIADAEGRKRRLCEKYPSNISAGIEHARSVYTEQKSRADSIRRFLDRELAPAEQRERQTARALDDAKKAVSGVCPVLGGECIRAVQAGSERQEREHSEAAAKLAELTQRARSYDLAERSAELAQATGRDGGSAAAAFAVFLADTTSGNYAEAFAEYSQLLSAAAEAVSAREREHAAHLAEISACDREISSARDELAAIDKKRSQKGELEKRLAELAKRCEAHHTAGLDTSQSEKLNSQMSELSELCGRLKQTVRSTDDMIVQLAAAIEKKRLAAAELEKCRVRERELAAGSRVLHDLREVLRLCGPKVAAMMRTEISRSADNIYRGMVRDGSGLEFADGYTLQLHDVWHSHKRVRSYRQLSGGEKMSAALAMRLALMRAYSPLSIGFFDEPTDGLDVHRREALCDMLRRELSGLEQVFIISHDSSFDSITDSVIDTSQLS